MYGSFVGLLAADEAHGTSCGKVAGRYRSRGTRALGSFAPEEAAKGSTRALQSQKNSPTYDTAPHAGISLGGIAHEELAPSRRHSRRFHLLRALWGVQVTVINGK